MSSQRRDQAIQNFDGMSQYQDEYQKATPELICDLLDQCRGGVKPTATQLLEEMARGCWSIAATLHEGGHGGGGRAPDGALHFTVRVNGVTHHFRARSNAHHYYIYDITS